MDGCRPPPASSPVTSSRSLRAPDRVGVQSTVTVTSSHLLPCAARAASSQNRATAPAQPGGNRALPTTRATAAARLPGPMVRNFAALPDLLALSSRPPCSRTATRWTCSWCSWWSATSVRRPRARRRMAPPQAEAVKARLSAASWRITRSCTMGSIVEGCRLAE
ncbi:hypothetical protein SETIT_7G156100v2 [Setaria italica]|uniref:Uncharacterized protein n=1 Tax=Setaria italica TaxID=4555 RepID=A0A368RW80_SETIT|nr:hypothetical protein SETIT_7G156100v2 [Setaria italica]